jgi:lysyl-tRNA synthetase class 2
MEPGLPPCSGVALGMDRLIMLGMGLDNIQAVMSFPFKDC